METIKSLNDISAKGLEKKQVKQPLELREAGKAWSFSQKFLFRVAFFFFLFMSIPTSASWYAHLFSMDWSSLHYRDLYDLARFSSGFSWAGNSIGGNNLLGYANWIITLLVSAGLAIIWTFALVLTKKEPNNYNILYYWLRVVVRYRAGIGIIGFGFTKLFPVQMPYPSEALLNTNFGDFTGQKIFWLSIGIVPWYQVFTGVVELAAGALLFFRRTEALGAVLLISALGTITYVNFAYDGGVHVYASYFTLYGLFILGHYVPRLYRLLILEKVTIPVDYFPDLSSTGAKALRYGLKTLVIAVFLVWLFYLQLVNFLYDPYKQPAIAGIPELRGNYEVVDFKFDGQSLPSSPLEDRRWKEVTFEKWSTLTFTVNRAGLLDLSNGGGSPMRDINRTFEISGVAGGRRAFYYEADTVNKVLYLQNKNTAGLRRGANRNEAESNTKTASPYPENWIQEEALVNIVPEDGKIASLGRSSRRTKEIQEEIERDPVREKLILRYEVSDDGNHVFLKGTNEELVPVEIQLKKVVRERLLSRSTLDAGKYD